MLLATISVLLALTVAPVDIQGRWEGTLKGERPDGTTSEDPALLILDQKDTTITGTIGGSESDRHPITSGKIDGNKVTILATNAKNGREYRLELAVDGDQMKGTIAVGDRRGELVLKKRKE